MLFESGSLFGFFNIQVLAEKEHKLHGRTIDPKRANPRPVNKKVFVGRLDPAITEDEVKAYFETFGPVSIYSLK